MSADALSRCVGDPHTFFEKHWGRAPLFRRAEDSTFDDLASFEDLDHMVSSLGLKASSLRMVKDGRTLSPSAYTAGSGGRRLSEASVSPALVFDRYAEGSTIVLESLHRFWAPLADFCRELELALSHGLQVNAYLTPPGSQGFDVHRDDHDVFVLQVWGEKHWTIFDLDSVTPLIDEPVRKGASLYIPKGFPHSARTGAAASAHLTVGILTHEAIDIVREIAKLAEEEPVFKARLDLPGPSSPESIRRAVEASVDDMRAWLEKIDLDRLTQRVARKLKSSRQPLMRGQLRQLELVEGLDGSSVVSPRSGATCFLLKGDRHLNVILVDRELQMPLIAAEAMQRISSLGPRERLTVASLHDTLDPESASVLVRRLIREGFLEVVIDV